MKLKVINPKQTDAFQIYFDIGFKCNMNCSFCYDHDNRQNELFKGTTKQDLEEVLKQLKYPNKYHKLFSVVVFGGEPTIYDELIDIVSLTKDYPIEFIVSTNGFRIATDDNYAKELFNASSRRVMFTTDWTWGNDYEYGKQIYNKNPEYKIQYLEQLRKYNRKRNQLLCIVPREYDIHKIKNTLKTGEDYCDVISSVGFNSEAYHDNMLRTADFLDILEKENIISQEEVKKNTVLSGEMFEECGDKRCCIRFKYKNKFIMRFIEFDNTECWMRNHILPNNKLSYMFEYVIARNNNQIENLSQIIK